MLQRKAASSSIVAALPSLGRTTLDASRFHRDFPLHSRLRASYGAPAFLPVSILHASANGSFSLPVHPHLVRRFRTSARRQASATFPFGIVQFASVLSAVTVFTRILITFFPIGILVTIRYYRGVQWIASEPQKPRASSESERFYQRWCRQERGIRPTMDEARGLIKGVMRSDGVLEGPDGRLAYGTPRSPNWFRSRKKGVPALDPTSEEAKIRTGDNANMLAHLTQDSRFYLPELSDAARNEYAALSLDHQAEVDALRRYQITLKIFKDSLRFVSLVVGIMLGLPCLLLAGVYLCGLERVPLTGRWRIVLLTPEEEDTISSSMTGNEWYRSVIRLLSTADRPAPPPVPLDDWRWRWVQAVLHQVEDAVVAEMRGYSSAIPQPFYPLEPRPRLSSMLHSALPGGEPDTTGGPPYLLMLLDKDEQNAFSYGFSKQGSSGIVVFTGLLDKILHGTPQVRDTRSFLSRMLGRPPPRFQPTDSQTLHLACVLAHEIGHLLLSHHLETISQQQVLWPSVLGFVADVTRAFIWPFTVFFGPTVNDALANVGATSASEMANRLGRVSFQWRHEFEADLAGLRLLTRAGFDPRQALDQLARYLAEHDDRPMPENENSWKGSMFKLWTWATHPSSEQRVRAVQQELERWELQGWRPSTD